MKAALVLLATALTVAASRSLAQHQTHQTHQTNVDAFHRGVPAELRARLRKAKSYRTQTQTQYQHHACATTVTDTDTGATAASQRYTPTQYGGDPTGVADSTAAVQSALKACLAQAVPSKGAFSFGVLDAGGCVVDLDGGYWRISSTLVIPTNFSNLHIQDGSLFASKAMDFMIQIGGTGDCPNPQGSCNEFINLQGLFLDANQLAGGVQTNMVMGTTIDASYFLNFTNIGVDINKGHEVMIQQVWLGETNFGVHQSHPQAVGVQIDGNDHYISDTIVFSALIGLLNHGSANYVGGMHVWFPWNAALEMGATAFIDTGGQNRYEGCYIDGSKAVFVNPSMVSWSDGFVLGGAGFVLNGTIKDLTITTTEFQCGQKAMEYIPPATGASIVNTMIDRNLNLFATLASRASKVLTSSTPLSRWEFDFCSALVFPNITTVSFSFTAASGFPKAVARPAAGCNVTIELDVATAGSMLVEVDTSATTTP